MSVVAKPGRMIMCQIYHIYQELKIVNYKRPYTNSSGTKCYKIYEMYEIYDMYEIYEMYETMVRPAFHSCEWDEMF